MIRKLALLAALAFFLASLCYRFGWFEVIRPHITYWLGDVSGCPEVASISPATYAANHRETLETLKVGSRIVEETSDGLVRFETPVGKFWAPRNTDLLYVLAEQLLRSYGDGRFRAQPGDIVLDCGANLGTFTWEALSAGAAKVIAIEPVPQNIECLERTFSEEIGAGRVVIIPKGVWHKEDTLEMYLYQNSVLDSFVLDQRPEESHRKPKKVPLPLTTIDRIVEELNLPRVDFIKMDIEGAERNALQGARSTVRSHHPRMSVAVENLEDDYLVVPETVANLSQNYRFTCGPCRQVGLLQTRPDILYFYSQ
jgi:FkbM family methyltransferase